MHSGLLYEATFFVAPDSAQDFDQWLEGHVRKSLQQPGVDDCNVYARGSDDSGRQRRVCVHLLADDDSLETFLDALAADLDHDLSDEFGDQVEMTTRVLREDESAESSTGPPSDCLNCGTRLRGQYCGTCGQRSRTRLISLWELISDAFGDLLELDSRLWQTLIPLLRRPGLLTHDYLQGRRARYMPPFRMYLVLSLLFFVVAFFDPREELSLLFEPQPEPTPEEIAAEAAEKQAVLDDLAERGVLAGEVEEDVDGFLLTFDDEGEPVTECDIEQSDLEDLPDWLARRLTLERLQRICERTQIDDGRALVDKMLDNIPVALIILLPLLAFVLKILYPLSKRYYVEHLLFFVHFHAFFFLILSLQILFMRLAGLLRMPEAISMLTIVITSIYIPVYLFIAMRRVYLQGRLVTTLKFTVLLVAYQVGFFTMMMAALAIAAFSI